MDDTVATFEALLLEGADRDARDLRALEPLAGVASMRPGGLVLYGHLCLLSGRPAQALRCYRDVLEPEPGHTGASLGRLVALDALGALSLEALQGADAVFHSSGEVDRRLLSPLSSPTLRRAAWISVGAHLAGVLDRRVAGQAEGRSRLVEAATGRIEGGPGGRAPIVALEGPSGTGKRTAIRALARALFRETRVFELRADEEVSRLEIDTPSLVMIGGLATARAEDPAMTARFVEKLCREPGIVLVALLVSEDDPNRRQRVGFSAEASSRSTLPGWRGTALARVVDVQVPFSALDEATALEAVVRSWRERTWRLAVEGGGWSHVGQPDFNRFLRNAWDGSGLSKLTAFLRKEPARPGPARALR